MRRSIWSACRAGLIAGCLMLGTAAGATAAPIHPGVQTFTAGAQCTANFVFSNGSTTYIGQAAHCAGTGGETGTNGCTSGSLPLGTPVTVTGATQSGTLAYSSWISMQADGETDADTCQYNDLALVALAPSDALAVDPSVPGFGGPTGVGATSGGLLDTVYSYGNSSLRLGLTALGPKQGIVLDTTGGGWSRDVLTLTPGIPGDSGSGFLDASGEAIGVLSTLELAPIPAANGVGDLAHELAYLHAQPGFAGVRLVPGTKPFIGSLLAALLGL